MLIKRGTQTDCAALAASHVNSDGRSASLTAPNGPAQQRLLRAVLSESGLQPSEIDVYEAHGTGTSLGDPIEVGAVKKVFQKDRLYPILLTCAKTNTGHMEGGAGISGFLKCTLMVMHNESCPNVHLAVQNPHLDLDGFPTQILSEALVFENDTAHAGVSSFGYGGTNGHCLAYGKNLCTSRGPAQKDIMSVVAGRIKRGGPPEIQMEGNYEEWWTTGVPHLTVRDNSFFHVEISQVGKVLWREIVEPALPLCHGQFFIQGSFNEWQPENLLASDTLDGLFTCVVTLGKSGAESFQVFHEDPSWVFFPIERLCTRKSTPITGPMPAPSREDAWLIRGQSGMRIA